MAATDGHRSAQDVRRAIEREREQLTHAVEDLRGELGDAANVAARLRAGLPLAAAGALGLGFVLGGGVGGTMRYLARRGREGAERARLGRYAVVQRK